MRSKRVRDASNNDDDHGDDVDEQRQSAVSMSSVKSLLGKMLYSVPEDGVDLIRGTYTLSYTDMTMSVWPPYETYPFELQFDLIPSASGGSYWEDLVQITTFTPSGSSPASVGDYGQLTAETTGAEGVCVCVCATHTRPRCRV